MVCVKFQDPPPGFIFTTLQSSSTLAFFTNNDDAAFRKIGRNMIPHAVKKYNDGLEKLRKMSAVNLFENEFELYKVARWFNL